MGLFRESVFWREKNPKVMAREAFLMVQLTKGSSIREGRKEQGSTTKLTAGGSKGRNDCRNLVGAVALEPGMEPLLLAMGGLLGGGSIPTSVCSPLPFSYWCFPLAESI